MLIASTAHTTEFWKATAWMHGDNLRDHEASLVRVKLGGIHRAQPFSHSFEAGTYSHYFLAPWATWPRDEQINAYERLSDGRINMPDVPVSTWSSRFAVSNEPQSNHGFSGFQSDETDRAATIKILWEETMTKETLEKGDMEETLEEEDMEE
ncbi:hypothetical protein G7Z17_g8653 [Cylindrodendrum hubeiense]|uniref:Uncharacterized protein n=1 Tax=Cylindrodendrum hubeiense TaxID=595255 RepID=A0A9P5H863_9HYPO|nr:hypothetical protein G7Z17_g8653 [Cylindrodendrum hubeiense]